MKIRIVVACVLLAFGAFPLFARPVNAAEPSVSVDYEYGDLKEVTLYRVS